MLSSMRIVQQSRLTSHHSTGSRKFRFHAIPADVSSAAGKSGLPQHPQEGPDDGKPFVNLIPNNGRWLDGVPPVMGAHLMASGTVSPISTSKGAGVDVPPHQFQYHDAENDTVIQLYQTPEHLQAGLVQLVQESAAAAAQAKRAFTLVLSGGSLPALLAPLSAAQGIDWSQTHIFFVDERNVPHTSSDSTYCDVRQVLLSKVPVPPDQVYAIGEGLPVGQAATQYEGRLISVPATVLPRNADGLPVFDLILLGVGPDGHVASLFPNRPETAATQGWILPVKNSPKPPPERITMTMPVINAAKEVAVVAVGEGKRDIVQRVLEVQALPGALPAQMVRPKGSKLRWLLDSEAADLLHVAHWGEAKKYPRTAF